MAKNTVGATESLAVQINSNFAHIGNNGATMGVTFDNKIQFENLFVGIEGSINDSFEWPFNWYAWNINHYYTDPNAIVIFSRAKGPSAGTKTATSIVVKAGVVTEIKKGIVNIPTDGYVITVNSGANAQQIFSMGYEKIRFGQDISAKGCRCRPERADRAIGQTAAGQFTEIIFFGGLK